ncbi:hypothetical protein GGI19_004121 [Coemansia pectinata]|uniref:Uncharacterized protein n=1 Tax=Coemansia pectinata TaxID=1052879 RepID=A0A9W8GWC0_9FUNG|nr:hypothetical protein GGI19_004121 [Coemansia pectinata]
MRLTNISDEYQSPPSWLQIYVRDTGLPAHLYAKELTIGVDVLDVYNGAAFNVLECEPYANCTFPKARSIDFTFSMPSTSEQPLDNATASPGTESNISAFVQRVKQITPMLKDIRISILTRDFRQYQFPVQHLDNLAAQLSQHMADIDYEFYNQPVIIGQRLSGLCKLVYSTIDFNDGGKQIIQLAQRNASTLQLLDIDVDPNMDMTGLIQNADGSYVQLGRITATFFS